MGTSAKSNWRKMRQKNTIGRVGEFYQLLIAELLGCEVAERGRDEYADVFNSNLGIRVEVKARDNNHFFGIGLMQKETYGAEPPFPLSDTLYALVGYRKNVRIKKGERSPRGIHARMYSPLGRQGSLLGQQRFLAEHVDFVYLLDIEIVNALEKVFPITTGHFAGREEQETIVFGRRQLYKLFQENSFAEMVRTLRLSPRQWVRSEHDIRTSITTSDFEHQARFKLITVVRKPLYKRMIEVVLPKVLTSS